MKILFKTFLSLFVLSFLLLNCGKKDENKPADAANTTNNTAAATGGSYGVKSGIVTFENVVMEGMNQTFYFDDYGKKEARYTVMEMNVMGQKIKSGSVEINADGFAINYNLQKKEGTKTKSYGSIGGTKDLPKDFANISKTMLDQYHMKDLGTKEFLGKECKGFEITAMGMKSEIWVWNNIMLYSKVYMGENSKPMELKASKIETDVPIPADKFQVPADVKIQETKDLSSTGDKK
jgi:hypothetical protein